MTTLVTADVTGRVLAWVIKDDNVTVESCTEAFMKVRVVWAGGIMDTLVKICVSVKATSVNDCVAVVQLWSMLVEKMERDAVTCVTTDVKTTGVNELVSLGMSDRVTIVVTTGMDTDVTVDKVAVFVKNDTVKEVSN